MTCFRCRCETAYGTTICDSCSTANSYTQYMAWRQQEDRAKYVSGLIRSRMTDREHR